MVGICSQWKYGGGQAHGLVQNNICEGSEEVLLGGETYVLVLKHSEECWTWSKLSERAHILSYRWSRFLSVHVDHIHNTGALGCPMVHFSKLTGPNIQDHINVSYLGNLVKHSRGL